MMSLKNSTYVFMSAREPEDILNVYCDKISQKLINCKKIKLSCLHLFQIVASFLTYTFHKVVYM